MNDPDTDSTTPRVRKTEQKLNEEKISPKAFVVWLTALAVYIVAITGRTSLGVAGVQALDRFHINASQLAVFTAVQVGVYALAQIPTGIIIDRIGAKKTMIAGAVIMAVGQGVLAATASYPLAIMARVLIGAGDATAFLGAMRLIPAWIPLRKAPLFTQLTAGFGQLGQFISAVPFLALLHASGWVASFASLAAAGVLIAICALIALADEPMRPVRVSPELLPQKKKRKRKIRGTEQLSIRETISIVVRHPVCWLGFFTHWTGLMHQCIFTLLWGMPLMTLGVGITPAQAGIALVANTLAVIVAGPVMGLISARASNSRFWVVFVIAIVDMAIFIVFFASPTAPSFATVLALNIGLGSLAPMSNIGFDSVREKVDRKVLATGTGLANMGGFIATMIASQCVGILLDQHAHGAAFGWSDFRFAWLAVIAIWAFGMIGMVAAKLTANRILPNMRHRVTLD